MFGFGDGAALRVPGPFSPSDVPNLELWLDGRDLVGADGDPISTWTKRAGASGTDALQATGNRQPIIKSGVNGLNGLPVARFAGVLEHMRATLDAGSTGFTIYIVGRSGSVLTQYGTVVGSGGNATSEHDTPGVGWAFAYGSDVAGFGAGWAGPDGTLQLGNVAGAAANTAFRSRYRTNKVAWSIDGPNSGTPADTSFPSGTFQCYVGCASVVTAGSVPNFNFNGDVAAVLVYSRALSGPEDTSVLDYILATWGV